MDTATLSDLEHIWRHGVPNTCNVEATEANFWSYYNYGNHSTLTDKPNIAYHTLLKDDKRGYCLIFDQRLAPFVLNAHFTPNGLLQNGDSHSF